MLLVVEPERAIAPGSFLRMQDSPTTLREACPLPPRSARRCSQTHGSYQRASGSSPAVQFPALRRPWMLTLPFGVLPAVRDDPKRRQPHCGSDHVTATIDGNGGTPSRSPRRKPSPLRASVF